MNKRIKKKKDKKFINSLVKRVSIYSKCIQIATLQSQKFVKGGIVPSDENREMAILRVYESQDGDLFL